MFEMNSMAAMGSSDGNETELGNLAHSDVGNIRRNGRISNPRATPVLKFQSFVPIESGDGAKGTGQSNDTWADKSRNLPERMSVTGSVMRNATGNGSNPIENQTRTATSQMGSSVTRNRTEASTEGSAKWAARVLSPPGTPAKGPKYNNDRLIVSRRLNLAANTVPKVMCSSIRKALNTLECGQGNQRCAEFRMNRTIGRIDVSNMTRIAFVRDPFERA